MATLMIVCPACGKCKALLPVGKPQPVTDQLAIEPAGRVRAATREPSPNRHDPAIGELPLSQREKI